MEKFVFISHSSVNAEIAKKLCEYLEERKIKCFIAPRDIQLGHEYAEEILNGIDNSSVFILMLSKESNTSPHVLREVERAVSKNIPIIVYKIENVQLSKSLEYFLMTHQWMDASDEKDFERIWNSVDSLMSKDSICNEKDGIVNGNTMSNQNNKNDEKANINQNNINYHDNSSDKKKKNLAAVMGVAAVAVLVIAVIVLTFSIVSGNNEKNNQEVNNSTDKVADKDTDNNKNNNKNESPQLKVELGETVTLGTYNDAPIEWSVLRINDDKTAVLVSDKILTFKAFDGAESGTSYEYEGEYYTPGSIEIKKDNFEILVQTNGNNEWSSSNIRTWVNSDKKNVKYSDSMPIAKTMSDRKNGYNTEPGFLYGFTDEEKNAIVTVTNTTKGYYSADGQEITTQDKVYLLTKADLADFDKAGLSIYASPTDEAVNKNETAYYESYKEIYHVGEYFWWLREPVEDTPHQCYFVTSGQESEMLAKRGVNVESFGIRPAITVDVDALLELISDK